MALHVLFILICLDSSNKEISFKALKLFYFNIHSISSILYKIVSSGNYNPRNKRLSLSLLKNLIKEVKNSSISYDIIGKKDLISMLKLNLLENSTPLLHIPIICFVLSCFDDISNVESIFSYICGQLFTSSTNSINMLINFFIATSSASYSDIFWHIFMQVFSKQVLRSPGNALLHTSRIFEAFKTAKIGINFEIIWNIGLKDGLLNGLKSSNSSVRTESVKLGRMLLERSFNILIANDIAQLAFLSSIGIDNRIVSIQVFQFGSNINLPAEFSDQLIKLFISLVSIQKRPTTSSAKSIDIKIPINLLYAIFSVIIGLTEEKSLSNESSIYAYFIESIETEPSLLALAVFLSFGTFNSIRQIQLPGILSTNFSSLPIWQIMARVILSSADLNEMKLIPARILSLPIFKTDYVKAFSDWSSRLPSGEIISPFLISGFISILLRPEVASSSVTVYSILQRIFPYFISLTITIASSCSLEKLGHSMAFNADPIMLKGLLTSNCNVFRNESFTHSIQSLSRLFLGMVSSNPHLRDVILEESFISMTKQINIWKILFKKLSSPNESLASWLNGRFSTIVTKCIEECRSSQSELSTFLDFLFSASTCDELVLLIVGPKLLLELPLSDSLHIYNNVIIRKIKALQGLPELYYLFCSRIFSKDVDGSNIIDQRLISSLLPVSIKNIINFDCNSEMLPSLLYNAIKSNSQPSFTTSLLPLPPPKDMCSAIILSTALLSESPISINSSTDALHLLELLRISQLALHAQAIGLLQQQTDFQRLEKSPSFLIPSQVPIKLVELLVSHISQELLICSDFSSTLGAIEDLFSDTFSLFLIDQELLTRISSFSLPILGNSSCRLSALFLLHILNGIILFFSGNKKKYILPEDLLILSYCCMFENIPQEELDDNCSIRGNLHADSKIDLVLLSSRISMAAKSLLSNHHFDENSNISQPLLDLWKLNAATVAIDNRGGTSSGSPPLNYSNISMAFKEQNVAKALSTQLLRTRQNISLLIDYVLSSYWDLINEYVYSPSHLRHRQESSLQHNIQPRLSLCSLLDAFWSAAFDELEQNNNNGDQENLFSTLLLDPLKQFYLFVTKGPLVIDPSLKVRERFDSLAAWVTRKLCSNFKSEHPSISLIESLFNDFLLGRTTEIFIPDHITVENFMTKNSYPSDYSSILTTGLEEEMKVSVCEWLSILSSFNLSIKPLKLASSIILENDILTSKKLLISATKILSTHTYTLPSPLVSSLCSSSSSETAFELLKYFKEKIMDRISKHHNSTSISSFSDACGVVVLLSTRLCSISFKANPLASLSPWTKLAFFDVLLGINKEQIIDNGPWFFLFLSQLSFILEIIITGIPSPSSLLSNSPNMSIIATVDTRKNLIDTDPKKYAEKIVLSWANALGQFVKEGESPPLKGLLFSGKFIDILLVLLSFHVSANNNTSKLQRYILNSFSENVLSSSGSWRIKTLAINCLKLLLPSPGMEGRLQRTISIITGRSVLGETHRSIQQAGISFLDLLNNSSPKELIMMALVDPSTNLSNTISTLSTSVYYQILPRTTIALLVPLLKAALSMLSSEGRKRAATCIGILPALIGKWCDFYPTIPKILIPALMIMISSDPVPANRITASRALASIATAIEKHFIFSTTISDSEFTKQNIMMMMGSAILKPTILAELESTRANSNNQDGPTNGNIQNDSNRCQFCISHINSDHKKNLQPDSLHLECFLFNQILNVSNKDSLPQGLSYALAWVLLARGTLIGNFLSSKSSKVVEAVQVSSTLSTFDDSGIDLIPQTSESISDLYHISHFDSSSLIGISELLESRLIFLWMPILQSRSLDDYDTEKQISGILTLLEGIASTFGLYFVPFLPQVLEAILQLASKITDKDDCLNSTTLTLQITTLVSVFVDLYAKYDWISISSAQVLSTYPMNEPPLITPNNSDTITSYDKSDKKSNDGSSRLCLYFVPGLILNTLVKVLVEKEGPRESQFIALDGIARFLEHRTITTTFSPPTGATMINIKQGISSIADLEQLVRVSISNYSQFLTTLFCIRFMPSNAIRQKALSVWKMLVEHTPRTLITILPDAISYLEQAYQVLFSSGSLPGGGSPGEAAATELFSKLGERVFESGILLSRPQSTDLRGRAAVIGMAFFHITSLSQWLVSAIADYDNKKYQKISEKQPGQILIQLVATICCYTNEQDVCKSANALVPLFSSILRVLSHSLTSLLVKESTQFLNWLLEVLLPEAIAYSIDNPVLDQSLKISMDSINNLNQLSTNEKFIHATLATSVTLLEGLRLTSPPSAHIFLLKKWEDWALVTVQKCDFPFLIDGLISSATLVLGSFRLPEIFLNVQFIYLLINLTTEKKLFAMKEFLRVLLKMPRSITNLSTPTPIAMVIPDTILSSIVAECGCQSCGSSIASLLIKEVISNESYWMVKPNYEDSGPVIVDMDNKQGKAFQQQSGIDQERIIIFMSMILEVVIGIEGLIPLHSGLICDILFWALQLQKKQLKVHMADDEECFTPTYSELEKIISSCVNLILKATKQQGGGLSGGKPSTFVLPQCVCVSCSSDDFAGPCLLGPGAACQRLLPNLLSLTPGATPCSFGPHFQEFHNIEISERSKSGPITIVSEKEATEVRLSRATAQALVPLFVGALVSTESSTEQQRILGVKGISWLINASGGINQLDATTPIAIKTITAISGAPISNLPIHLSGSRMDSPQSTSISPVLTIAGPLIRVLGERLSSPLLCAILHLLVEGILLGSKRNKTSLPDTKPPLGLASSSNSTEETLTIDSGILPSMRVFGPQLFRCMSKILLSELNSANGTEEEEIVIQLATSALYMISSSVSQTLQDQLALDIAPLIANRYQMQFDNSSSSNSFLSMSTAPTLSTHLVTMSLPSPTHKNNDLIPKLSYILNNTINHHR